MIDRLEQHEAFLRAIFAAPDDDTPRLVYADFLEEHGFPDRAELIRLGCEHRRLLALDPADPDRDRLPALRPRLVAAQQWVATGPGSMRHHRGFDRPPEPFALSADDLADPAALRARVVADTPEWFGAVGLKVVPGRPLGSDEVAALFDLPFTQQVTEWDLGGHVEEVLGGPPTEDAGTFGLIDLIERPVVTLRGVEALATHRGARRIRTLTMTHNQLGNDAVRALARSPYLIRLERLDFRDGNSPKGRVWQELVERFGEQVVG
ncbi:MAG: TIGR02996 domain-containing protein [Gemmataceae bacterium]|nr:TIGR02996 domain-containing protein [Gemmataceae bacterium]